MGRDVAEAFDALRPGADRDRPRVGRAPARQGAVDAHPRRASRRRSSPTSSPPTTTTAGCSWRSRPNSGRQVDAARRAEIDEDAPLARRAARVADPAAVPDQQVREARPVRPRHEPHQVALDLHRILLAGEAEPLRQPADVRVDDDPLRVARARPRRRSPSCARRPVAGAARRSPRAPRRRTPRSGSPSSRAATSPSGGRSRSGRCRARAPRPAPPGSPRVGGTSRNSVSVTRLTFTSVVCAESITETSSSSGFLEA